MGSASLTYCQWRHFRALTRLWKDTSLIDVGVRSLASAAAAAATKALKMRPLKPVIGLEIHAQIHAKSKLFSGKVKGSFVVVFIWK